MAAERTRPVAIQVEVIHHDTGHWCLSCKQATGIRAWAVVGLDSRMHMQIRLYCYECQGRHVVAETDVA